MTHITVSDILNFYVFCTVFTSNQGSKLSCSATTGPFVQDICFQMITVV